MKKMGMVNGKFLWDAKRKALSGIVFGLMMALPGISGAQGFMTAKMTSAFSTEKGTVSVKTDYISQIGSPGVGVEQNQYLNKVYGIGGGPTTVIAEFATNGNCEIDLAGLTILKNSGGKGTGTTLNALPGGNEPAGMLQALEKIGTGYASLSGSFGAAGGSEINVTETKHSTTASTKGGGVYYLVESSGVGMIKAGVASEVCMECAPREETNVKKAGLDSIVISMDQSGKGQEMGSQSARMNVEYNGQYKGFFEGIIAPPK